MKTNAKSISVQSDAYDRLEAIAKGEYRSCEGQIMAMCDLWEQTYGVKQTKVAKKPPKLTVVMPTERKNNYAKTPEHRKKISQTMKGRKMSSETKKKISHAVRLANARKRLAKLQEQEQLS